MKLFFCTIIQIDLLNFNKDFLWWIEWLFDWWNYSIINQTISSNFNRNHMLKPLVFLLLRIIIITPTNYFAFNFPSEKQSFHKIKTANLPLKWHQKYYDFRFIFLQFVNANICRELFIDEIRLMYKEWLKIKIKSRKFEGSKQKLNNVCRRIVEKP